MPEAIEDSVGVIGRSLVPSKFDRSCVTSLAFEQCLSVLPNRGDEWVTCSTYYCGHF